MARQNPLTRSKKHHAQTLLQERRFPEALEIYRQIVKIDRRDAEAWFSLGLINGLMGRFEDAVNCNQEAIAIRPDFADAHFNHAKALQTLGRLPEAQHSYERALACNSRWPEALNNLGNVLQARGQLREAGERYHQALTLRGDFPEALMNLGNVLKQQGQLAEAVAQYRRALALAPTAAVHKALGGALVIQGRLDEALGSFREAARLDPADHDTIAAEAAVLERQGRVEQAYALIRPFIDMGMTNLEIGNAFAALCDQVGRCEEAIVLLEKALAREREGADRQRRVFAHFNLGRMYDRKGEYDKAFAHFKSGNDIKPHDFNGEEFTGFIDALIATFDADFLGRAPRAMHGSQRPVFIVGMPRSGTSLVEQILSSHPQVFGGGELEDIRNIAFGVSTVVGSTATYPYSARELTVQACEDLAARYLERLAGLSADARYVTDKMPQNFLALGLIAILFPQARIIHCLRDPMDTCLSCYFHDFSGYHPYVYSLESLGFYHRQYQRLMAHWRRVLPLPMLEISYETLVQDQGPQTRALLAFCDLPWDERCMRFYDSNRVTLTSSYQQVRKPIYHSSIARWRRYETHLAPLMQALGI